MADEDNANLPTTWTDVVKTISEGGIPQFIAGPAGKAISRLIAGAADVPAAWLNSKAQSIKDETEARTTIMKAVATASAETAVADPLLLDRALTRYIADLHRKQENREAVAEMALEELNKTQGTEDSSGPSDDWMNVFEEYAEKASSEELRQTWARVLAGEIRKPSSFSLKTLQFLSVLDKASAEAAEAVLSRSFDQSFALWPEDASGTLFANLNLARLSGIIGQIDFDTTYTQEINQAGTATFSCGGHVIHVLGNPGHVIRLSCTLISLIGKELYPVIKPEANEDAITQLVDLLKDKPEIEKIMRGKRFDENGTEVYRHMVTVWSRST